MGIWFRRGLENVKQREWSETGTTLHRNFGLKKSSVSSTSLPTHLKIRVSTITMNLLTLRLQPFFVMQSYSQRHLTLVHLASEIRLHSTSTLPFSSVGVRWFHLIDPWPHHDGTERTVVYCTTIFLAELSLAWNRTLYLLWSHLSGQDLPMSRSIQLRQTLLDESDCVCGWFF